MAWTEPSAFGIVLRQHRLQAGLTQEGLAEQAHVSARTVSDLERGVIRNPQPHTFRQLADALQLPAEERKRFAVALRARARGTGPADAEAGIEPMGSGTSKRPDAISNPVGSPPELTSFVGRERELALLQIRLRETTSRILTLVGPGGIGKTRLALRLGREMTSDFGQRVYFVSLASVQKPELVPEAIVVLLKLESFRGDSPLQEIEQYFREREALLIVDNFEQVLEAGPFLVALAAICPKLKILVTSRTILRVSAETVVEVPPLASPGEKESAELRALTKFDAVNLFMARARAHSADFPLSDGNVAIVADICRRLEGLPLAIELAAARTGPFSLQEIRDRLSRPLTLLTGGARDAPGRQQTLRATIDWSYRLLDAAQQRLLAQLAVFVGGCTLDAAEAVCSAPDSGGTGVLDNLISLVDHSLVRYYRVPGASPESGTRFTMLETIREYASERLRDSGESDLICRRHAEYYTGLAEWVESELSFSRAEGPPSMAAARLILAERDNLQAALSWAVEHQDVVLGLRLVGASGAPNRFIGLGIELRQALVALLSMRGEVPVPIKAKVMLAAGTMGVKEGYRENFDGTYQELKQELHSQAIVLRRQTGDKRALLSTLIAAASGIYSMSSKEYAKPLFEEALELARELGSSSSIAACLRGLGEIAQSGRNDMDAAKQLFEESLTVERAAGSSIGIAFSFHALAWHALLKGDGAAAMAAANAALPRYRAADDVIEVALLECTRAVAALQQGHNSEVLAIFQAVATDDGFGRIGFGTATWLRLVAAALAPAGRAFQAARLLGSVDAWADYQLGDEGLADFVDLFERCISAGRSQLGEAEWQASWRTGHDMTQRQAIDYALDQTRHKLDRV